MGPGSGTDAGGPAPLATPPAGPDGPGVLGRAGDLEVRLARGPEEVRRAQRLRFEVFYEQGAAVPGPAARLSRRDADAFDAACDHLLVLDTAAARRPFRTSKPKVIGTYRLLRRSVAERGPGFYSAGEYDLAPLLAARPDAELLELGRSCVLRPYRTRRTVELLWRGLWAYALLHRVDALIGCASLDGTDLDRLAGPLSFLHHHARSPEPWLVRARPELRAPLVPLPREAVDARAAFKALPPLLKGYLRVGATFGDGAVIDRRFGTTDVFAVMPVPAVAARYAAHFGPPANRLAA